MNYPKQADKGLCCIRAIRDVCELRYKRDLRHRRFLRKLRAIRATRTHYLSLGRRFMEQESGEIGWMQDSWPPLH